MHKKCSRDFVRLKPAQRMKRQGHLRFQRESGVATCEDQTEPLVGDVVEVVIWLSSDLKQTGDNKGLQLLRVPLSPANAVYGFMPGGLDPPGQRTNGNTGDAPLVECGGEGFLGALLGQIEVANE